MRRLSCFVILLLLGALARGSETRTVRVVAESSHSYNDAVEKALRNAVREVAGVTVDSLTHTRDYRLVEQVVLSRARGIVESYRVVNRKLNPDGPSWSVELEATVSKKLIKDSRWAAALLIHRLGYPFFSVKVLPRGNTPAAVPDWVTSAVGRQLDSRGLTFLTGSASDDTPRPTGYVVTAAVSVKTGQRTTYNDLPVHLSEVTVTLTVSERAGGRVLGTETAAATSAGLDGPRTHLACRAAVDEALPRVLDRMMQHWSSALDRGRLLTMHLDGLPARGVAELVERLRALREVEVVRIVEVPLDGPATVRLLSRLDAPALAPWIEAWLGRSCTAAPQGADVLRVVVAGSIDPPTADEVPSVHPEGPVVQPPVKPSVGAASSPVVPYVVSGSCAASGVALLGWLVRRRKP